MSAMVDLLLDTGAIGWLVSHANGEAWDMTDASSVGIVRIGVHGRGPLPRGGNDAFDILLTTDQDAPRPWVTVTDIDAEIAHLESLLARQPIAAAMLAQVLRLTRKIDFEAAILIESMAYSTLLASGGFDVWRTGVAVRRARNDAGPRVRMERVGETLEIILDRPRGRNAVDAAMRDSLVEALEFARLDPDRAPVVLRGEGAVFSIGGDLAEFGQAADPAAAHAVRMLRSVVRGVHAIRDRTTARLHGPCIGAGIEIPAASECVTARPRTTFRLPEVEMGLIPGAGGTATIARRIGRHRACWMAIGGRKVDLDTALAWGLVDRVET